MNLGDGHELVVENKLPAVSVIKEEKRDETMEIDTFKHNPLDVPIYE